MIKSRKTNMTSFAPWGAVDSEITQDRRDPGGTVTSRTLSQTRLGMLLKSRKTAVTSAAP
jgi:hypothetical protein